PGEVSARPANPAMIAVETLAVRAGAFALDGVSFRVETGQYAVLMGKTGSGKTTLLEAVAGLKPVRGGRVLLMGHDVTRLKAAERAAARRAAQRPGRRDAAGDVRLAALGAAADRRDGAARHPQHRRGPGAGRPAVRHPGRTGHRAASGGEKGMKVSVRYMAQL